MNNIKHHIFPLLGKLASPFMGRGLYKNVVLVRLFNWIYRATAPDKIRYARVFNHLMYLGEKESGMSKFIGFTGKWEPFETSIFQDKVKQGMKVVDIGANIGYYTLLASEIVGKEGMVFAFEPSPYAFAVLQTNIKLNNTKNVIAINKAVLDTNRKTEFYTEDDMEGYDSIVKPTDKARQIEVEAASLDTYLRGKPVDFIKIDVQGAEILALRGMKTVIENSPNLQMFIEYSPEWLKKAGFHPHDLLKELSDRFNIWVMDSLISKVTPLIDYDYNNFTVNVNLYCERKYQ